MAAGSKERPRRCQGPASTGIFHNFWRVAWLVTKTQLTIVTQLCYNRQKIVKEAVSKFVAYKGRFFTIEWYFDDRGNSKALEYYESLSMGEKNKVLYLFQLMGDFGTIRNQHKFNAEGDQIYAFKPIPHRFLSFFFTGAKIIVTNAFEKKQQKLPWKEKDRALKCRQDYESRVKKGSYYEK